MSLLSLTQEVKIPIKLKRISIYGFGWKYPASLSPSSLVWLSLKGATLKHLPLPFPLAQWTEEARRVWRMGRISIYLTGLFFSGAQRDACYDVQLCVPCMLSKRCPTFLWKYFIWCMTLCWRMETNLQRRTFWSSSHIPSIHPFWVEGISKLPPETQHVTVSSLRQRPCFLLVSWASRKYSSETLLSIYLWA